MKVLSKNNKVLLADGQEVRHGRWINESRHMYGPISAEGNLNTMMIGLNGSGTSSDPYTPIGGNEYTTDLLHPNDEGAKRYGRLAGKVIAQRFLGFN